MTITVTKTLPSSDWYTGTGSTTISLVYVSNITINTKKALIKIKQPESKGTQAANPSDKGRNFVKDLKRIEDTVKLRGWVIDDEAETAWNKAWKLRGMAAAGGAVDSLIIENVTFSSATQQATIEETTIIAHPLKATFNKNLNEIARKGIARVEMDLLFYLGDVR